MEKSQDFIPIIDIMTEASADGSVPCSQVYVIQNNQPVLNASCGQILPDKSVTEYTRFDLASVTKLFTTAAFMKLTEMGKVSLDDPVSSVLPEFTGLRSIHPYEEPLIEGAFCDVSRGFANPVDAGNISFRQLLTHTSGLPAWRPFYRCPNRETARSMALHTFFSYKPDSNVIYSDLSLILTGWAIEKMTNLSLNQAVQNLITNPLSLSSVCFRPLDSQLHAVDPLPPEGIAQTEICHWRKWRLQGEVDDENSAFFGGISGHAGLFSTARDLAAFGNTFLNPGKLLLPATISEMTHVQTTNLDGKIRRGIGFQLWTDDPAASWYPFSSSVFGHMGFTGTALWIDPEYHLSVALLTNEVFNGRKNRKIASFRSKFFTALMNILFK